MKNTFLAKFIVLAMVLALLPVSAFAAARTQPVDPANENDPYHVGGDNDPYSIGGDSDYTIDSDTDTPEPIPSSAPKPSPVLSELIKQLNFAINGEGVTVMTATIKAENDSASVELSGSLLDSLVQLVSQGDAVVLVAETSGAVSAPADKLTELVEKTGSPVLLGNQIASVSVGKELLALAGGASVTVGSTVIEDGTIDVCVTAGGRVIHPGWVSGGIDIEIPVSYPVMKAAAVSSEWRDAPGAELEWSVSDGKLKVNLTAAASIRIEP